MRGLSRTIDRKPNHLNLVFNYRRSDTPTMDDESELRDRIDKLEQIVVDQQETIEELEQQSLLGSWGRRGVLGGIAAALGLASASGSAAAGVGDLGTPSERVDVFADTLDATSGLLDGDDMVGIPSGSQTLSLSLGAGYSVINPNKPTIVMLRAVTETDGSSNGILNVRVDESGGTTKDYRFNAFADSKLPAGTTVSESLTIPLPAGAAISLANTSDPNNANEIDDKRVLEL